MVLRSPWDSTGLPFPSAGTSTGISEERSSDEEEEGSGTKTPEEQSCRSALP